MTHRVLIVDHDGYLGRSWRRLLALHGWRAEQATSLRRARMLLAGGHQTFDTALLDLDPRQPDDLAHLPGIVALLRRTAIVLVSAAEGATAKLRLAGRCDAMLLKPVPAAALIQALVDTAHDPLAPWVHRRRCETVRSRPSKMAR